MELDRYLLPWFAVDVGDLALDGIFPEYITLAVSILFSRSMTDHYQLVEDHYCLLDNNSINLNYI